MTREDAIKIFNTVLLFGKCDCPKEEIEECLKMAIKALEQEPTTKNDLGVDCISRADALALYCDKCALYNCISKCASYRAVEKMPSVTPQEPMPMVEIDLYSVIKQKYIEREVLDKISAEIKDYFSITCDGNCDNCNRVVKNPCGESVDGAWVLHIIDKYKEKVMSNANSKI